MTAPEIEETAEMLAWKQEEERKKKEGEKGEKGEELDDEKGDREGGGRTERRKKKKKEEEKGGKGEEGDSPTTKTRWEMGGKGDEKGKGEGKGKDRESSPDENPETWARVFELCEEGDNQLGVLADPAFAADWEEAVQLLSGGTKGVPGRSVCEKMVKILRERNWSERGANSIVRAWQSWKALQDQKRKAQGETLPVAIKVERLAGLATRASSVDFKSLSAVGDAAKAIKSLEEVDF